MNFLLFSSIILFILAGIFILVSFIMICRYKNITLTVHGLIQKNEQNQVELKKLNNPLGNWITPNTQSYMLNINRQGKIIRINDELAKLLGYHKKDLINKNFYPTLIPQSSAKEPLETNIIKRIFDNPKLYAEHETELTTKSGQKVWISWTNRVVYKNNKPIEIHSVGFNITKRKELEAQLQFLASTDPKTGVLNRQALLEVGTRELKRTIRYKHPLSVLLLQITLTQDTQLSTPERDTLLQKIVALSRATIRDVDYFGRIGEVEFVMILPETAQKNILFLQQRLMQKITEYNQKHLKQPLSVKFGSASYSGKDKSIDTIIMNAYQTLNKKTPNRKKSCK